MNLSTYRCVNDIDVAELVAGMDQAERSGAFDGLFSREEPEPVLGTASKEQLLQSIAPAMKLTKGFFKRIYGYELTWFGFADQAIKALEAAGCSRARQYYDMVVSECDRQHEADLAGVACWYAGECTKEWGKRQKEGEEQRKLEIETRLQRMSNSALIALCASLTGVN